MNMNDLSVKDQIFFDELIAKAQRNKIEAQQLALDAGKLLSIPEHRLYEYKDSGFFKRCWGKISGKQGELMRATQKDLIEMQKFAWIYLMKLQEQNLIQAKAIAVIRNNLQELAESISDISMAISVLVEKFDKRITKQEEINVIQDWLHHLDYNKYEKSHTIITILQIVFDYFSILQSNTIGYDSIEGRKDIDLAFKKWNIDLNEKLTVEEFIIRLAKEIHAIGLEQFNSIVSIRIGGDLLTADFILDNISGAGYNSLYAAQKVLNNIASVMKHVEKENPQELMIKTLKAEIVNPGTNYSFLELAKEFLAGTMLAEEIYREKNALPKAEPENETIADNGFSIESLLEEHSSISYHAFLKTSPTAEEKQRYIESFSIIFAGIGEIIKAQEHYLSALTTFFECENCLERIKLLTSSPKRIDIKSIINLLNSTERQYTWFVDAIFFGNCVGNQNSKAKTIVLKMSKLLKYKENELITFIEQAESLAIQDNPQNLFEAIRSVNYKSDAWITILDFRGYSLKGAFTEIKKRINQAYGLGMKLSLSITSSSMQLMNCNFAAGDENLFQRTALKVMRTSCISKFKEHKKETESIEDFSRNVISDANEILAIFGTKPINYSGNLYNINADESTSVSNENWGDNMSNAFNNLSGFIEQITYVLEMIESQLRLYEEGKYHESVMENRKKQKMDAEVDRKRQDEEKKVVKLSKGDATGSLTIKWEKITKLPFDHERMKEAVCDGKNWLLLEDMLWESTDGTSWLPIKLPIDDIGDMQLKYINSIWVLWKKYSTEYYYSYDKKSWGMSEFPNEPTIDEIFFANEKWYLQTGLRIEYSYVKEGLIWDSNETGYCSSTHLYESDVISGGWTKLGSNYKLEDGIYIPNGSIGLSDGIKVALCAYDYLYVDNKHLSNVGAHFVYSEEGKSWQKASFPKETFMSFDKLEREVTGRFIHFKDKFLCASSKGIYVSIDGKKWDKTDNNFSFSNPKFIPLGNLICLYGGWGKTLYVSTDGISFQEMLLENSPIFIAVNKETLLLGDTSCDGGLYIGKVVLI